MSEQKKECATGHIIEVKGGTEDNFDHLFERFKQPDPADERSRLFEFILGFSGGADDDSPLLKHVVDSLVNEPVTEEEKQEKKKLIEKIKDEYVENIVRSILEPLRGHRVAILTGGTKYGAPKAASTVAKELGFPTIGVYPLRGKNDALSTEILDLSLSVHPFLNRSEWGDESAIFTKLLDAVVVIGGGAGTMVEVSHLLKQNEKGAKQRIAERKGDRIKPEERRPVKHIVPVSGTGGTADAISSFPGKWYVMGECLPKIPLASGAEVAQHLKVNVLTEEALDLR